MKSITHSQIFSHHYLIGNHSFRYNKSNVSKAKSLISVNLGFVVLIEEELQNSAAAQKYISTI